MIDERRFIAEFEASSPAQAARWLREATPEQERALRAYLGTGAFGRMRAAATRMEARSVREYGGERRRERRVRAGVHGECPGAGGGPGRGGGLARSGAVAAGGFHPSAAGGGRPQPGRRGPIAWQVGVPRRFYGPLLVTLAGALGRAAVRLRLASRPGDDRRGMEAFLIEQFGSDPVHLVAHSTGGLGREGPDEPAGRGGSARASGPPRGVPGGDVRGGEDDRGDRSDDRPARRARDRGRGGGGGRAGRPGHHSVRDTFLSFPGLYAMLPREEESAHVEAPDDFFDPSTYLPIGLQVSPSMLGKARSLRESIDATPFSPKTLAIEGEGFATPFGVDPGGRLDDPSTYRTTLAGDGLTPLSRGNEAAGDLRRYRVGQPHAGLPGARGARGDRRVARAGRDGPAR